MEKSGEESGLKLSQQPSSSRRLSSEAEVRCPKRAKFQDKCETSAIIKIGSRKSKLALVQTDLAINALCGIYHDAYKFDVVTMTTTGDHILDTPLSQIGSKSLFTKELEDALLNKAIHLVVHSLKDLPTTLPPNLCITIILDREDPSDALVLKNTLNLDNFNERIKLNTSKSSDESEERVGQEKPLCIGTSSLRRIAQLLLLNPNIQAMDIRGNLNTRLKKLDDPEGPYDALVLAAAGLERSGFASRISKLFNTNWWHAVGQGALAVEYREDDAEIVALLSPLIDYRSTYECIAERTFMQKLEGGCSVPLGVQCIWEPETPSNADLANPDICKKFCLTMSGAVFSLDGTKQIKSSLKYEIFKDLPVKDTDSNYNFTNICLPPKSSACYEFVRKNFINCAKLGADLADKLTAMGAGELLSAIKSEKTQKTIETKVTAVSSANGEKLVESH